MTTNTLAQEYETAILVEGPAWGDARFYGKLLLAAAESNELLKQARRDDPVFNEAIENNRSAVLSRFRNLGHRVPLEVGE
jgi:hypothetical protein